MILAFALFFSPTKVGVKPETQTTFFYYNRVSAQY